MATNYFDVALKLTAAELDAMNGASLAGVYNTVATGLNRPTIKKFKDKATALGRVEAILTDARAIAAAAATIMSTSKVKKAAKPVAEKVAKAPRVKKEAAAEKTPRKESVSAFCQRLILAGKTNDEVWAELQPAFNLDDSKKYYPSWNRSFLKRNGKIT